MLLAGLFSANKRRCQQNENRDLYTSRKRLSVSRNRVFCRFEYYAVRTSWLFQAKLDVTNTNLHILAADGLSSFRSLLKQQVLDIY
jgi:hypothetical protein